MVAIAYGQQPAHEPYQRVSCYVKSLPSAKEHLCAREEQKGAKEIKRPVERFNECDSDADHESTQNQRTQNTPEQHTVLVSCWHGEIGKDEYKDEDVIDAERIFDQIAGKKLEGFSRTYPMPDQRVET